MHLIGNSGEGGGCGGGSGGCGWWGGVGGGGGGVCMRGGGGGGGGGWLMLMHDEEHAYAVFAVTYLDGGLFGRPCGRFVKNGASRSSIRSTN